MIRPFSLILFVFLFGINAFAQKGSIKGTIRTSDQKAAEFVNVGIADSHLGTTTAGDGTFKINGIAPGTYVLIASYVGMEKQEMTVVVRAGETTIQDFTLKVDAQELKGIVISSDRQTRDSEYVGKMPLKQIENPQVYNTISADLIQSQAITSFDDALNNAPGIAKLWESTGRGGDGSSYYALRGFEAQATMVNGLPGLTNGSLDPSNIERIEVIKGPSGTLFGSSLISYGGLINTVTKKPYHTFGGELTYTAGSFGLNRVTADVNTPLHKERDIALRINTAYHNEGSFQDAGFRKAIFLAPSLSYKVNERLSFIINTEFIQEEKTNPTMLFLNRSNPLLYANLEELNYNRDLSLTSNDLSISNPRFNLQGQMLYKLSDKVTSQTVFSRGQARSFGYYSYLWDSWYDAGDFELYISDQNAQTATTDIQQNFIGDFKIGKMRNRVVVGIDYFSRHVNDNSSGYVWLHDVNPQGEINYVNAYSGDTVAPRYLSAQSVDALLENTARSNSNVRDETYSAYVSDVFNITPTLLAMASIRIDHFNSIGDITTDTDNYEQTALSPKFGLMYQPVPEKVSVFANYMNGFKNVAPRQVADADGSNPRIEAFEPEHANQIEFGVKTNLFSDKLIGTVSYYHITLANVVIADASNMFSSVQGGVVESTGYEADITAKPVRGLSLIASYSFNESEILEGDAANVWFEQGKRPIFSGPQTMANIWATYELTRGKVKGLGFAFGGQYASELAVLDSEVTGRFELPEYTIMNAAIYYNAKDFRLGLNVNNVTDVEYYKGYSTINPQKPRNIVASFSYRF